MTGKAIVPIIAQGNNEYKVTLLEQATILQEKKKLIGWFRQFRTVATTLM